MRKALRLWCWIVGHRMTVMFHDHRWKWDAEDGLTDELHVFGEGCARCGMERPDRRAAVARAKGEE